MYGDTKDGELDESNPRKSAYPYGRSKIRAEQILLREVKENDFPAVLLQPTIVYGPYCQPWTMGPAQQMKTNGVALVDDGMGLCNAVYVDDVVQAIILSLESEKANGEAMLISARQAIRWLEFYQAFGRISGKEDNISFCDKDDAIRNFRKAGSSLTYLSNLFRSPNLWRKLVNIPLLQKAARWVERKSSRDIKTAVNSRVKSVVIKKPAGSIVAIPPERANLLASKTTVSIAQAENLIGYQPRYSFEEGMSRTADFLHWYWGERSDYS